MSDYLIVAADAIRARFFTLEAAETPETQSGPRLVEQSGIMNPKYEETEQAHAGSSQSGRNRAPSGASYSFDDHRAKREHDLLRRFARLIVEEAARRIHNEKEHHLVLTAEPRMLGLLRGELNGSLRNGTEVKECDCDMVKDSPDKIQELLARRAMLPACQAPAARQPVRKANGPRPRVAKPDGA